MAILSKTHTYYSNILNNVNALLTKSQLYEKMQTEPLIRIRRGIFPKGFC